MWHRGQLDPAFKCFWAWIFIRCEIQASSDSRLSWVSWCLEICLCAALASLFWHGSWTLFSCISLFWVLQNPPSWNGSRTMMDASLHMQLELSVAWASFYAATLISSTSIISIVIYIVLSPIIVIWLWHTVLLRCLFVSVWRVIRLFCII